MNINEGDIITITVDLYTWYSYILGPPNMGVRSEILVATQFFQVSYHFPMIFIKMFTIFPGVLSFFQVEWEP